MRSVGWQRSAQTETPHPRRYALTAALAHLASSPAVGASLLLCGVDEVFDALLRCHISVVREGSLAAIGLLLEHEQMGELAG